MEAFTDFLANNFIWFIVVAVIMLFALIGYAVDVKETKLGHKLRTKKEEVGVIDFTKVQHTNENNLQTEEMNLDISEISLDEKKEEPTFEIQPETLETTDESILENVETLDLDEDLTSGGLPELNFEGSKEK